MGVGGGTLEKAREAALDVLAIAPGISSDQDRTMAFLASVQGTIETLQLAHAQVSANVTQNYNASEYDDLSPCQTLRYDLKMASGAASASLTIC